MLFKSGEESECRKEESECRKEEGEKEFHLTFAVLGSKN